MDNSSGAHTWRVMVAPDVANQVADILNQHGIPVDDGSAVFVTPMLDGLAVPALGSGVLLVTDADEQARLLEALDRVARES